MVGKRIYGLDILRAVAILTVLIAHSGAMLPEFINKYIQGYAIDGVSIFFVLSGFLIGHILLKIVNKGDFDFRQLFGFWIRRWFRTLPAFFVTIFILLSFYYYKHTLPGYKVIIRCLTFSQSLSIHSAKLYREGWSLSVEEWFYLLIPLILYVCHRILKIEWKKLFLSIITIIIIITAIVRYTRWSHINSDDSMVWDMYIRSATFMRMDSIMFGVLGAYLYYYNFKIWQKKDLFFWTGLLIYAFMEFCQFIHYTKYAFQLNLTLESVATLFLLPKLNSIQIGKGGVYKILTFISIISYSLYLMNATPFLTMIYPYFREYFGKYEGMYAYNLFAFILFMDFRIRLYNV